MNAEVFAPALIILSIGVAGALIFGSFAFVAGIIRKLFRKQEEASSGEEALLLKELHRNLNRLEQRIESLETIITNAETKRSNY